MNEKEKLEMEEKKRAEIFKSKMELLKDCAMKTIYDIEKSDIDGRYSKIFFQSVLNIYIKRIFK